MPESSPREFLSQTPSADTAANSPSPSPSQAEALPGVEPAVHRFRVNAFHAKGGLGVVYRATDTELDRHVALKRIQERFQGDANSLRRFLREAEITARLEHPGIVPIYGLVHDEHGHPSYAMRFVEGQSLQEAIRAFHQAKPDFTSLAFRQLLQRFVTVCQTVAYAHSKYVIHRDLKPANILLGPYGETLVVDWGLAKELPPSRPDQSGKPLGTESLPLTVDGGPMGDGLTQVGQVLGTAAYMPPEQAKGLLDLLGPTADVYALGAVLYEMLTGAVPYGSLPSDDILARLRRDQPPERPRLVQPTVPPVLEAIGLKAMALKPEDRYATAEALARDVERWSADEPVSAWREPVGVRLRRWLRRHQALAATVVVLLAAVAVLAGVAAVLSEQRRQAVAAEQIRTEEQ